MTMSQPLLADHSRMPMPVADLIAEAALRSAEAFGQATALHAAGDEFLALLTETVDRSDCPRWLQDRLLEQVDAFTDAGDEAALAAEAREDVLQWLLQRRPLPVCDAYPTMQTSPEAAVPAKAKLQLVPTE